MGNEIENLSLRELAERRLKDGGSQADLSSLEDRNRILYELTVHQIELEMQNEELSRIQEELSDSLDRYSDLYDFAPVSYLTVDSKGKILAANLTACELFEQPRSKLVGASFASFLTPEHIGAFYLYCQSSAADNRTCEVVLSIAGSERMIRIDSVGIGQPGKDTNDQRMILTDITEEKARVAKREEEQFAIQCDRTRTFGVIAGGIAHDLSNFLTPIRLHAEMALSAINSEPSVRSNLNSIIQSAEDASSLCEKMLDFSGTGPLIQEPLDIVELLQDLRVNFEKIIPHNIEFSFDVPLRLSAVVGDKIQIERMINNLVSNAIEAIGEDRGKINLTAKAQYLNTEDLAKFHLTADDTKTGRFVEILVSDDGCGMDGDTLSRVFDPFFTTKLTGRGLGMSSVLGIARGHCAAIDISSSPEQGTIVSTCFPVNNEDPTQRKMKDQEVGKLAANNSGTILVVDDDDLVRKSILGLVEFIGFSAVGASTGVQALEMLNHPEQRIDFVLLDIVMPEMDGVAVLKAMRNSELNMPVVLISGYSDAESLAEIDRQQISGFLKKPFSINQLVGLVNKVVEGNVQS